MARKPRLFSTAPITAMQDRELTGLEWRVLLWVSLHDGMSLLKGSGAGCYASNLTLFAEVGCDYSAGCRALSNLVKRGHLAREQVGRSTRYRVVFGDPDSLQAGNLSAPQQVAGSQVGSPGYVAEHAQQEHEKPTETPSDYSPRSGELHSVETGELDSTEVADVCTSASSFGIDKSAKKVGKRGGEAGLGSSWSFAATLPHNFRRLPAGAQVARFEQAFADIGRNADRFDSREREAFAEWLNETAETFWDQPHGQQAQRLFEEINEW